MTLAGAGEVRLWVGKLADCTCADGEIVVFTGLVKAFL